MAPLLMLVAAVAAIGSASGQPLPSANVRPATAGERSLRGGRRLQTLLCNSIGCPIGYTPITDAMNVECDGDTCEASQCCEAFCSYHPCPMNFIPIADAATTLCEDFGCTDALCCEDGTRIFTFSPTPSPISFLDPSMTDDV